MQSNQRVSSLAIAVLAALSCAGTAHAQNIVITNANNHTIPLASGSSVQIDVNGNLLAQCALTNGTCTQLSNGGANQGAPAASLSRNDGDTDVKTGEFVRLAWSASGSPDVCVARSTGPVATTFAGPRAVSSAGETVTLATAGDYTFFLQCFNESGGSSEVSATATVTVGETQQQPPSGCSITSTDPAFQPPSFGSALMQWHQAFDSPSPNITLQASAYPQGVGTPVPIGANKNTYTAIQFTSKPDITVDLSWDTVQAQLGYSTPRPAEMMFIGISPCPGDLRAANTGSGDPWLQNGCRIVAGGATIFYTTRAGYASNDTVCKIEPNQTYYINVSPINPNDGLQPGEHTCSTSAANSANGCDVQARHTGS